MTKRIRPLTAFLLAIVLTLSLLPANVWAATLYSTSSGEPNVTLSTADGVQAGQIRYISQHHSNPYYQSSHWGSFSGSSMSYCWAACMSMSLSYLNVDKLPKDILKVSKSEENSPRQNCGVTYLDDIPLEEAMDNYIHGNGAYSPPVIKWTSDSCYNSTNQHFVLAIGQKGQNLYEVTDPLENSVKYNFIRQVSVNGTTATSTKTSTNVKKTYDFKIVRIYQYYKPHATWLENGELDITDGVLRENSGVAIRGQIGGTEHITSVTAGCYDLNGDPVKGCNETVEVDSVGYDLSELDSKLQFGKLSPGFYEYRVTVKMASGETRVLHSQTFTVRNGQKNLPNATFYFDNGANIKYCVTATSDKKGSVPELSWNTESDSMKISAQAVGSNGYYRLMVEGTGLYLTVYNSSSESGTKVIQHSKVDKSGQYWQILSGSQEGYYYLVPKCAPDCCLSVKDDAVETGGTLEIRTAASNAAQYWLLRYTRPLISNVKNVASGVQVSWDATTYATGYQIYRAVNSSGSWKLVKTVNDGETATWVDTNVTNGTKYRYKLKALYGSEKSPLTPEGQRYRVSCPTKFQIKSSKAKKLTVTWSVNSKGTGYQICYATNKSFSKSRTLTVSGKNVKTKTISGLTRGKKYYVKMRVCKKVGQDTYYSAWTTTKAIKVK